MWCGLTKLSPSDPSEMMEHEGVTGTIELVWGAWAKKGPTMLNPLALPAKAGVMANHVSTHVVGPLHDLGTNARKEGLGQPTVHQHDPFGGVVCQEQSHGSARPDGFGVDVLCVMSEDILASKGGAGVTKSSCPTGDSLV
jgi:hypothetical protein